MFFLLPSCLPKPCPSSQLSPNFPSSEKDTSSIPSNLRTSSLFSIIFYREAIVCTLNWIMNCIHSDSFYSVLNGHLTTVWWTSSSLPVSKVLNWPQAHCRQVPHWDFFGLPQHSTWAWHTGAPLQMFTDELRATCIFSSIPKWEIISLVICGSLRSVKKELYQEWLINHEY